MILESIMSIMVSAQPSCGDILTIDTTLTADLSNCDSGNGLILNASGITLDCNGHSIHSADHQNSGILLGSQANRVAIKNCEIINFNIGIDGKVCANLSDAVVQDTFVNNNTIGIDFFHQCGVDNSFFRNLTFSDVNFSALDYALDIDVDLCDFENLQFSCDLNLGGTCEATSYFDNIRDCNIDGWTTINSPSAFDIGIFIGGVSFKADRNSFNNVFLNVTNGNAWGVPYGFWIELSNNITINNSAIYTDDEVSLVSIINDNNVKETRIIDTKYPYGKELITTGALKRFWRVNISSNIDDVNITATSTLNTTTFERTRSLLRLLLLEYEHNISGITNSTPYAVRAIKENETFEFNLSIGNLRNNSFNFSRFTDSDNDKVAERLDNCRLISNPDQRDTDNDGNGDVCDRCPLDSTNSCDTTESTGETVSQRGGIVNTSSGNAEVNISSGALENSTSIIISGSNTTPRTNLSSFQVQTDAQAVSLIYTFGPDGIEFTNTVTITIKYNDTGIDERTVVIDIYFYNSTTRAWVPQGAVCDKVLNECTLTVNHFSDFIVGAFLDTDGDGIADIEDVCPITPGKSAYQGCPVGDENLVELHVIDKAKTFCSGQGSCKIPIENIEIRVFNRNDPDFQALFTKNPKGTKYPEIYEADIAQVGNCTTNASGMCVAGEEAIGDYLVIAKYTENDKIVYTGKPKSPEDFVDADQNSIPDLASKDFQIIKVINKDSSIDFKAGSKTTIKGSILEVISPQYVIWDNNETLYPFIFISDSEWEVDVCLLVPQGYEVVDGNCEQIFLANEAKDLLFTVVEVGSPEPNINANIKATHNNKAQNIGLLIAGQRTPKYLEARERATENSGGKAFGLALGVVIGSTALSFLRKRKKGN